MLVSIGEAALILGVSTSTLKRWEREGKLSPAQRTFGGHRRYDPLQLPKLVRPHAANVVRKTLL